MKYPRPAALAVGAISLAFLAGCSSTSETSAARGLAGSPWPPGLGLELPADTPPEGFALGACGLLVSAEGPIVDLEGIGGSLADEPDLVALLTQASQLAQSASTADPAFEGIAQGAAAAVAGASEDFAAVSEGLLVALEACATAFPAEAAGGGWNDAQAELQDVVDFEEEFGGE